MALKQQMIARLTGVNAPSAAKLARETGISQQNLSRWLSEARSSPIGATDDGSVPSWTAEQKARIIVQSSGLAGDRFTAYLEREGVKLGYFRRWRLALAEAGQESVGIRKRIRKLERELVRKERALAEAAALLLLREAIESQDRNDNDGIDGEAEEEDEDELNRSMSHGAAPVDNPMPSSSVADHMRRSDAPFPKGLPSVAETRSAQLASAVS
jgi:hypothetical protein